MRKGSIVLIPFPFTDLSGQKVRPAVVLNASHREDCIVAFISSTSIKKKRTFEIPLKPTEENGLKTHSHIKVAKLATLQKSIIIGELGTLDATSLKKLDGLLTMLLGLSI